MMVGSPFSFLDRGRAAAPVTWAGSFSPGVLWSAVVAASFLWFLLNDRIQPVVIYCLKLFLVA
ncbi:MAG: hypothetical protein OXH32_14160 [Acidobacteria bacterium]|nr:hypothetical protein [Acidobacteriota bacterium]MXZ37701.1 hypothetical protein [Holophagales bacterium]MYB19508.1 hypothetical protein [Holophagales bacterium]MYH24078.1 hypothetical protein [Holophagales bacterium]MYJ25168.1 hypothetical protein [Holophagales bacterium]